MIADLVRGSKCLVIPFAGGMSELFYLHDPLPSTIILNDLHADVVNLALCLQNAEDKEYVKTMLHALPYSEHLLARYQEHLRNDSLTQVVHHFPERAVLYFYASWVARNGAAGTPQELKAGISYRNDGHGGDSVKRYRTAVESMIDDFHNRVTGRATILCRDAFKVIRDIKDNDDTTFFIDPPFRGVNDVSIRYVHDDFDHARLASLLHSFHKTRMILRYYIDPRVFELFTEKEGWQYINNKGRRQTKTTWDASDKEILLIRNCSTQQQ